LRSKLDLGSLGSKKLNMKHSHTTDHHKETCSWLMW